MKLDIGQIREVARAVGFPVGTLDTAAAVAYAESNRGDTDAVGDQGTSFGLWQIHLPAHPKYVSANLFDPFENARAALDISKNGSDWTPWSTYTHGDYTLFLPTRKGAVVAASVAILGFGLLGWYLSGHGRLRMR